MCQLIYIAIVFLQFVDSTIFGPYMNTLQKSPPMGWSTWGYYVGRRECDLYQAYCLTENVIKTNVGKMTSLGFRRAGYHFVQLDSGWQGPSRTLTEGQPQSDVMRFPQGLLNLSLTLQSMQMHLGLGTPISDQHLVADMESFIDWEIEYLSLHGTWNDGPGQIDLQLKYAMEMHKKSRPFLIACNGGHMRTRLHLDLETVNWTSILNACNSWNPFRNPAIGWDDVFHAIDWFRINGQLIYALAGPGRWYDLGPLSVGNPFWNHNEQRTQMLMWCLFASPLFFRFNVGEMDSFSSRLLRHPWLIAINQDTGVRMPIFIGEITGVQLWSRRLFDQPHTWAIAFMNGSGARQKISLALYQLMIDRVCKECFDYLLTEVFSGEHAGTHALWDEFAVLVDSHDTVMYHVRSMCAS